MLQADFHDDGSGWMAIGTLNHTSKTLQTQANPLPLDISPSFRFFELGYRECAASKDCPMVSAGWILGMGSSIVRDITYDSSLKLLLSNPVSELALLRGSILANITNAVLPATDPYSVVRSGAASVDIALDIHVPVEAANLTIGLLGSDAQTAPVQIAFTVPQLVEGENRMVEMQSGTVKYRFPLLAGESLSLRLVVDKTIVEAFVQGGRAVASILNRKGASQAGAEVFVTPGLTDSVSILRGQVSDMGCGWQ